MLRTLIVITCGIMFFSCRKDHTSPQISYEVIPVVDSPRSMMYAFFDSKNGNGYVVSTGVDVNYNTALFHIGTQAKYWTKSPMYVGRQTVTKVTSLLRGPDGNLYGTYGTTTTPYNPVMVSTDDGITWNTRGNTLSTNSKAWGGLHFFDQNEWLVANNGSMWRSLDAGYTWARVMDSLAGVGGFSFRGNFGIQVAGAFHDGIDVGAVLKSTDKGNTWKITNYDQSLGAGSLKVIDERHYIMFTINGKIIETLDGGDTWQTIVSQLSFSYTGNAETGIASAPLLVMTAGGTLYLSSPDYKTYKQVLKIPEENGRESTLYKGPPGIFYVVRRYTIVKLTINP